MRTALITIGVILAIAAVIGGPFVTIWAANGLFHAGWSATWTTWAQVLWFEIFLMTLFSAASKKS